jgi:hypothetical protein
MSEVNEVKRLMRIDHFDQTIISDDDTVAGPNSIQANAPFAIWHTEPSARMGYEEERDDAKPQQIVLKSIDTYILLCYRLTQLTIGSKQSRFTDGGEGEKMIDFLNLRDWVRLEIMNSLCIHRAAKSASLVDLGSSQTLVNNL